MTDEFLTESMLADLLGIANITIRKWRAKSTGPAYIKVGKLIRYRRADVDEWIASQTIATR